MKRSFLKIVCFVCACVFSTVFCEGPASPESLPVRSLSLQVVGESVQPDEFLKTLSTKEQGRFAYAEFDKDLKLMAKEYDRVEPSVKVVDGEVVIALKVWKKPIIHEVSWKGNQTVDTDTLKKELGIASGAVYDRQGFNKAMQKVRQYYIKKGFFESEVEYKTLPQNEAETSINVEINIKEGRAGFIEEIRFHNFTPKEISDLTDMLMTKEYSFWLSWFTSRGIYYKDVFRQDEHTVLTYLQNKGLLDAKVTSAITPSTRRPDRIIVDITAERGRFYYLGSLSTVGGVLFPQAQLLAKTELQTKQKYSPQAVASAAKAMTDFYGSKGYIDANTVPETKVREGEHVYDVTFKIEEGACFRVGMIQIVGNTRTDTSVILHETLLVPGAIFDSTLLAKTEERLRNIGYFKSVNAYAVKSSKLSTDDAHFRDVHIEVEEVPTTARFTAFAGWNSSEGIGGGVGVSESNFRLLGVPYVFSEGYRALRGAGEYASLNASIGTKARTYTASWTKPYFLDTKWVLGVDYTKRWNAYAWDDYVIHSSEATVSGKYGLNAFWTFGTHYRIKDSDVHLRRTVHTNRELLRESKIDGLISAVGTSLQFDSTNHPLTPTKGFRSNMFVEYAGVGGDHRFISLGYLNSAYFSPFGKSIWKFRADARTIKPVFGSKPHDPHGRKTLSWWRAIHAWLQV